MKIAIVGGSGKMGVWFADFLQRRGYEILIIGRDPERLKKAGERLGVDTSDKPEAVKNADVVVFSVPIDSFESIVRQYGSIIDPGQSVIEITSVKTVPLNAMHRYLKTAKVLGVHPMFGPGASDLTNQNFILTPTTAAEETLAARATSFIESHGGKVSVMSPEDHDKTIAVVLGIPHIMALVAADTLLSLGSFEQLEKLGGSTCKLLMMLADSVLTEDPKLYASIQTNIPGIGDFHRLIQENLTTWIELVVNKDRQGFINRMQALSDLRRKTDPEFQKAYDKMYRVLGNRDAA